MSELKRGYKQTEVGVIPEDWECGRLEEYFSLISYGFTNPMPTVDHGVYMVTAADIAEGRIQVETARKTTEEAYRKLLTAKSKPLKDDILLTKDGSLGRLALVGDDAICINQSVAVIRPNRKVEPIFLKMLLESPRYQRRMIEDAGGSTIKHIYITIVNLMLIGVPPSREEQRAIAGVLGDVDALIGALDRLITKKRDLKQAAMQQLLTGQTRLPGFSGKWTEGSLGDVIAALEAGVSVNSVEDDDGTSADHKAILKTSAVVGGRFLPYECKRIAARDLRRAKLNPRRDTLLISRMNTPELVGECGHVDRDYPNLFVPDRLWMTRFRLEADINSRWLTYLLSTPAQRHCIGAVATGTSGSMKNLSKPAFLSLNVLFPCGEEQTAIASVLSNMDSELSALAKRRDKTRLLKQGMMQELLTGRIRLS